LLHVVAIGALVRVIRTGLPLPPASQKAVPVRPDQEEWIKRLVFIPSVTAGAGGGGGGNRQPGPIRQAEGRGTNAATIRTARPRASVTTPMERDTDLPELLLDTKSLASGTRDVIGLPEGGSPYGTSTGPGSGGGVGSGMGTGIGSGSGPGVGPGHGGGFGGGVYRIGGGVSAPTVIHEVHPSYPPDALRERIQGSVVVELVVTTDGLPAAIRVIRPLSSDLDEAAVRAVREWRFNPGRLGQTPVNVRVTIILDFTIH
jgi:protein TonB